MAKDTQSSCQTKGEENSNAKGKQDKGSTPTVDISVPRRLTREMALKKVVTESTSSSRKSERLEKKPPIIPPINRKRERIEKQMVPSPLRRSERCKDLSPSMSSGSMKSDRSSASLETKRKKESKERSVKRLTFESTEVRKSNSKDMESGKANNKRTARAYKTQFKKQKVKVNVPVDNRKKKNIPDDSTHDSSSSCKNELGGENEHRSKGEELRIESQMPLVGSNHGVKLSHSSSKHSSKEEVRETEDGNDSKVCKSCDSPLAPSHEGVHGECSVKEKLQILDGRRRECSVKEKLQIPDGRRPDDDVNLKTHRELMSLKRRRNSGDLDSDASVIERTDICSSAAVIPSSPSYEGGDLTEKCDTCYKMRRTDDDLTKQECCSCQELNQQPCDVPTDMDRRETEVGITAAFGGISENNVPKIKPYVDLQPDADQNTCLVCKLGGKLLCCKGRECNRSFHLSCLDPPLEDVPLGVWHCISCTKKKMESGVHSVSQGIESILDVREVVVSGPKRQKQFFVKYINLAHVHNRWVTEDELPVEALSLVSKFNRRHQGSRWKQEWAVPHRLLKNRLVAPPNQCDEYEKQLSEDRLGCQYEWLVKWCGLDYDHATWELENAPFFTSPEGQGLVQEYKDRREKAKIASYFSTGDKTVERQDTVGIKLSQLTSGASSGFDSNHLHYVRILYEIWQKRRNAIVVDDQERIGKIIAFILTLQPDVFRPFLVISTSAALGSWEDELLHLAPSMNVVVYKGNKRTREKIRTLEFYEETGCVLFQVLLVSPEVLAEDIDVLGCIGWEATVIDECQRTIISSHFEQVRLLTTDMKLLVLSGLLKDSKDEYTNMLSLLDSKVELSDKDALVTSSDDDIATLKERLFRHIAYKCVSTFVEYWVPAQIAPLQLEKYCATLLSNSTLLCSFLKNDVAGVIHDVLISARKCCNHPYTADVSILGGLYKSISRDDILDVGIEISGKLQLLGTMLTEMKSKGLRTLILFQPIGGSGRDNLGDILEDFLGHKFGLESYEHVERGVVQSKKQSAINRFNDKELGRFVFLLELRACHSIKLSSIDSIIIYNGDLTPMNGIGALQKLTLDPQLKQIKVFRLYLSCTVEEKALILSMQNKIPDSDLRNISRNNCHTLLMWGASHLFDLLEKFHECDIQLPRAASLSEESILKDVVHDLLYILPQNAGNGDEHDFHVISKVEQSGGVYSTNHPLFGEKKLQPVDEALPQLFWTKLLEGKHPQWKYPFVSCQGSRKRVQPTDEVSKISAHAVNEVVKKRKVCNTNIDQTSIRDGPHGKMSDREKEDGSEVPTSVTQSSPTTTACKNDSLIENHAFSLSPAGNVNIETLEGNTTESEERGNIRDVQKSLHMHLKPEILKLCQILQLPENVKSMVEMFLEYVITNHRVDRESSTILQAFQISLCWTAASLLKHKIKHTESLALAKQHLNFNCQKDEADTVYFRLRCLKRMFSYHYLGGCKITENSVPSPSPAQRLKPSNLKMMKVQEERYSLNKESFDDQVFPLPGLGPEFKLAKELAKSIKDIKKKSSKELKKLMQRQQEQRDEIKKEHEEKRLQLEKRRQLDCAVLHTIHSNTSMGTEKLKKLEIEFAKKIEEEERQLAIHLDNLEKVHLLARDRVAKKKEDSLENLLSWARLELLNEETSNGTFQGVKSLHPTNKVGDQDDTESAAPIPGHHSKEVSPNKVVNNLPPRVREGNIEIPEISSPSPTMHNDKSNGFETMGAEETCTSRVGEQKRDDNTIAIQENAASTNPCLMMEVPDETTLSKPAGEVLGKVPVNTSGGTDEAIPVDGHTSEEKLSNEVSLAISNEGIQQKPPPVTVGSSDGVEGVPVLNSLPDEEQHIVSGTITYMQGGEVVEGAHGNIHSCDFEDTGFPVNITKSSDISPVSLLDNFLEVPEALSTGDGSENLLSADPSASEEQIPCEAAVALLDCEIPLVMNELDGDNPNSQINVRDLIVPDGSDASQQDATEPAPQNSPLLQPVTTLIEDVPVPLIQRLQDGSTQPSPSTSLQVEVTPVCTMENTSQVVQPTVCQSNHQVSLTEPQTEPFRPTDSLSGCTLPDLPVADVSEHYPIIEGRASNRYAQMPMELVENSDQLNQASFQPGTSIALHHLPINTATVDLRTHISDLRTTTGLFEIGHDDNRTTQPVVSQVTPQLSQDPLQNELLRIQKETHEIIKFYEEKRLQVKLDCEKEIEEVVAQIRRKYEAKMKEPEAEFVRKKKELDANHSKVLMNKILAEAFRSKCMDLRASNTPGMQRDLSSSSTQHPLQASHPWQDIQRPSSALPSSSPIPPSPSPHTYPIPTANLQQVSTSGPNWPTSLPAPPGPPPPIHGVHTSVLLSSNLTRPPPHINSIPPTPQLRTAIRAPAPHLQPFRTSASISATCPPAFQRHSPGSSTTISPSVSQLPPLPSISPRSGPCNNNRVFEPEMSGGLLTPNISLSASELLRSVGALAGVNIPSNLSPLPDLVPNINPRVGPGNSEQGNAIDSGDSMDVVCLSDDE